MSGVRANLAQMGVSLLSLKDIRFAEKFSGKDGDFESWAFVTEAMMQELGWTTWWEEYLSLGRHAPLTQLGEGPKAVSENMYLFLTQRVEGKAQTLVKLCETGHGLEAMRRIYDEYRPAVATSRHGLLVTILQPSWWGDHAHAQRPFLEVLLDWESLVAQYERDSGEKISGAIRCATVMTHAPMAVKNVLNSSPHSYREDWRLMKELLRDTFLRASSRSYVPPPPGEDTSGPMNCDAIGWDKPKCEVCGRLGHVGKDCWHKEDKHQKGKDKGKGKGKHEKGNGKGKKGESKDKKNPHSNLTCRHCGKVGHIERDCWTKHGKPSKNVRMVTEEASDAPGASSSTTSGTGQVQSISWVMAIHEPHQREEQSMNNEVILVLDGGSDEHCSRRDFALHAPLLPSKTRLQDAQENKIPVDGERTVNFSLVDESNLGLEVMCKATFQVGNFGKNLLSVGKLRKQGFIVHYGPEGVYVERNKLRVYAVCLGNTFGLKVNLRKDVGAVGELLSEDTPGASGSTDVRTEEYVPTEVATEIMQERANELRFGEQDDLVDVPMPLSVGSKVADMRARLKELSGSTHGTKDELWSRLKMLEKELRERQRLAKGLEAEQLARAEGKTVEVRTIPKPEEVSQFEKAQHALTHTPAVPWCEACIAGHGNELPHKMVPFDHKPSMPLVYLDFAFNTGDTAEDRAYGTSLVLADAQTGWVKACAHGSKGADRALVDEVVDYLDMMAYRECEIRVDNEQATLSLQAKVRDVRLKKGLRTVCSSGKTRDSPSMGAVESSIRWWRSKVRTLRYDVQQVFGVSLTPDMAVWKWLCRHGAWLNCRFKVRRDGVTAFMASFGVSYTGAVLPFGEICLAKLPRSSGNKLTTGNTKIPKWASGWCKGAWVGKTERNDMHILMTPHGLVEARTVRRLGSGVEHDQDFLKSCTGLPHDDLAIPVFVREKQPTPLSTERQHDAAVDPEAPLPPVPVPTEEEVEAEVVHPIQPPSVDEGVIQMPVESSAAANKRRSDDTGDGSKRVRFNEDENATMQVNMVGSMQPSELDVHDKLNYSDLDLMSVEIDKMNSSEYHPDEVREGKIKHLETLEEFGVFKVISEHEATSMKKVSTKWEIAARGGTVKCRFVAREFKWLEERDDVFAPASLALTSRVVDYLMCKDDKEEDRLVGFIADCTSAFLQAPQDEECAVDPPAEWIMLRKRLNLDWQVKWQLLKQLPGQRGAGVGWTEYCASKIESIGGERCDSLPHFFKVPNSRTVMEVHMDDIYGVARQSEIEGVLNGLRKVLKLKASGGIVVGTWEHLKRTRMRGTSGKGVFIRAHEKHIANVIKALQLTGTNAAKTPYLNEERPEEDEELSPSMQACFRSCIGGLMYLCTDRPDIQREVCILASSVRSPKEYDMRKLIKVARYLIGTSDYGTTFRPIKNDECAPN
eukprot:6491802-Amphidinium_carterae.1